MRKLIAGVAGLMMIGLTATLVLAPLPIAAQEKAAYVGAQVCAGCHKEVYDKWLLTPHRQTLVEGRPVEKTGCEACHGPGGPHVAGGGDKSKIIRPSQLNPSQVTDICLKCHKQADVILYRTSIHSTAKISCTNCHHVHDPGKATMLGQIDSTRYSIEGLNTEIADAKQKANIASTPEVKAEALAELERLEKKKAELKKSLDVAETRTRREFEPELCYTCHKEQKAQFKLPTHHPVPEGRVKCTGCHNPHGGARGNLREETVNQTCFKCHAEKEGPYVFEHPPVSEDCTICHRPHGSPQSYLLKQSEPFLCLKCHAGPHSRRNTFNFEDDTNPQSATSRIPYYYWQCTSCHNRPHGSDRHAAFHY